MAFEDYENALAQALSKMRKVKYGDYVLADDHNTLVDFAQAQDGINKLLAPVTLQRLKGIYWFNNHWLPANMMFWEGTGNISWYPEYMVLRTAASTYSYVATYKNVAGVVDPSWEKNRRFGVYAYFGNNTNQIIHLVSGMADYSKLDNVYNHIGFKAGDSTIYATVGNGANESYQVLDVDTILGWHWLEAVLVARNKCVFYVDGEEKATITTNLPTGTELAMHIFRCSIMTTTDDDREVRIAEVRVLQEP